MQYIQSASQRQVQTGSSNRWGSGPSVKNRFACGDGWRQERDPILVVQTLSVLLHQSALHELEIGRAHV